MLRLLSLCSGIAGGELGVIAANLHHKIEPVQFVERDSYCQQILQHWFPQIPIHSDLETFHAEPGQYDLIIAGFPCQPHSLCGDRNGDSDKRNLWPYIKRIIQECKPIGFILENVPGIRHSNNGQFLRDILSDIAQAGYDAEWGSVTVRALGGVHKRERFFLIAYPQSQRWTSEQFAIAAQARANNSLGAPDNPAIPHWTSTLAKAIPAHDELPAFLAGCLMKTEDFSLNNATIKATAAEVREPLQAVGNAIAPLQVAQVWTRLYERLCYLER